MTAGGVIHQANSNTLKGLSTQGVSYALLQLKPGGALLPMLAWRWNCSQLICGVCCLPSMC